MNKVKRMMAVWLSALLFVTGLTVAPAAAATPATVVDGHCQNDGGNLSWDDMDSRGGTYHVRQMKDTNGSKHIKKLKNSFEFATGNADSDYIVRYRDAAKTVFDMTCSEPAVDVNIDTAEQVEEAVEEVLAEVPSIENLVEETLADVADLEINENADVVVELETDDGATVEIPDEADEPIVLESADGNVLEVELPGNGDDAEVTDDGSVVYEDAVTDTDIVVQAQDDGGVRMIAVIDGADAPDQFSFEVDATPSTVMMVGGDGSVGIVDTEIGSVSVLPAPWAYDAEGNEVPSWYTIVNDAVVLNVDHSSVAAYPVVADPCWSCWASGATTLALGYLVMAPLCSAGPITCGLGTVVGVWALGVAAYDVVKHRSAWPMVCMAIDAAAGIGASATSMMNNLATVWNTIMRAIGTSVRMPSTSYAIRRCR